MDKEKDRKKRSIAIVDDHPVFRKIVSRTLKRILPGCLITEMGNGKIFLQQLETQTFDLVLMDVKMPVMDGIVATREAIKIFPDLKILALSMYDDPEYLRAMKNAGAIGYLVKGSGLKKMEDAIQHVLNGHSYFYRNESTNTTV